MIRIRDHQTAELFDPWDHLGPKRRAMLERSWAGVFRKHLLRELPVREFAQAFCAEQGRPSKDLYAVAGVLVLQQLHDLTDAATVEALAFNMAWHYALDIRDPSDVYICEWSLRNYRRIAVEGGLDEKLFCHLTDRLLHAFRVDTSRQRLDSTSIRSAMRTLTRLGILVETLSKFLCELSRVHPGLYALVPEGTRKRYVERAGSDAFDLSKPSESRRRLPEAARDLWWVLQQFRSTEAQRLESYGLLKRVFEDHVEVVTTPDTEDAIQIREPSEVSCESVQNPSDPDASYNARRGQGYRAQVMETYCQSGESTAQTQPDLITHVSLTPMTRHDGQELGQALDDLRERDVPLTEVVADSHYGAQGNLEEAHDKGVDVVAPVLTAKGRKQGKLTLEQFDVDTNGCVRACPKGASPVRASRSTRKIEVSFRRAICEGCEQLARCPVRLEGARARMQYTAERVRIRIRRLQQESSEFKERYRWRAGIEATMSRLKHQMRLSYLRVRGRPSVKYAVFLRALGLNICRCAATLQAA